MNGTKWLASIAVLILMTVACKRQAPPPPQPRKKVVQRKAPVKTELPRGITPLPQEVVIHPKSFKMGSDDTQNVGANTEAPVHDVVLKYVYAMWSKEISQDEFREMMGYNPSYFQQCGKDCPVENVNWHEAAFYCNRLSQKHGFSSCFRCTGRYRNAICEVSPYFSGKRYYECNGFRLPTEAEWEYAARAGSEGMYYKIPPSKNILVPVLDRIAWYGKNSQVKYKGGFPCSVKQAGQKDVRCGVQKRSIREPNVFGLHDMLGNVSEWVYDRFGSYPGTPQNNPIGSPSGRRVFRGCNWFHQPQECRVSRRFQASPSLRNNLMGFRPVRTLVLVHTHP